MTKSFVHLHHHSEFSILDGAAKIEKAVEAVVRDGQPALATTDHGNCYGLLEHYKACNDEGIKPILGIEAYMALDNVDERPPKKRKVATSDEGGGDSESGRKINYHLSLLAENNTGYQNLLKLSSEAFLRGYYYKPRVDWDILSRHSEGLIATTGCLGGITLQHLLRGEDADALATAARLQDIFGPDNLFVELQDHGIPEQAQTNPKLIEIATKLNAPLIATNDSHYVDHSDHLAHDSLLCLQTGARIADENRFKFASTQHYIKSASEMRYLFREIEVACDNTLLIAERADVNIEFGRNLVPKFDVPDEHKDEEDYLRALVYEGVQQRWTLTDEVTNRIEHELETIVQMGFAGYFLIVWDLIRHAKSVGIRVGPARGCLDGDELIWTTKGYKPIKDISIGDKIRSHRGSIRNVIKTFKYKNHNPLIRVRAYYDGGGVSVTPDHKLLVVKKPGSSTKWVEAKDVSKGDFLCIPRPIKTGVYPIIVDMADYATKSTKINPKELIENYQTNRGHSHSERAISNATGIARSTLRRYRSTGLANKNTISSLKAHLGSLGSSLDEWLEGFGSASTDTLKIKRFIDVDESFCWLLGAYVSDGWIRKSSDRAVGFAEQASKADGKINKTVESVWGISLKGFVHTSKDLVQWDLRSSSIRNMIAALMPEYKFTSQTKSLPDWTMELPPSLKMAILKGLWWGDGCTSSRWSYASTSRTLIMQIRDLLWSIGLPAGVYEDDRTDSRDKFSNRSTSWVITTSPEFNQPKIQFGYADKKYVYSKVFKTEEVAPVDFVYDLEVTEDHSFMTNSYVAHNSAGGSAVSYALGITEIDPLRWNLLFERFLNPSRVSMPDIDIDIDNRYREHMINYTTQKYGEDRVARIITFTQIKSRSALRDAARVLGEEYSAGDKLARELPPLLFGKDTPIEACLNPDPKYDDSYLKASGFRRLYNNDEASKRIVDVALGLEGLRRSDGIHAAAVVIAPNSITNYLPIQQKTIRNTKKLGPVVTQYEMHGVEDLGLVKMDFLGLRNLNVITDTCKMTGIEIDNNSFDDPAVYELLSAGDTIGVFQLESTPMRSLLFDLKPDCFEDIAAVLALYRPGPMAANMHNDFADRKHGRQPSRLFHSDAKDILAETHGLMIYQEQVMAVAQKFAGYSGTEADNLRRSMGKKITEEMDAEESKFIAGVIANGYEEKMATKLFATMAEFANYAFTSAHAFGYAVTSYQTAFLKVHHPTEYMAALMTSVQNNHDKLTLYLNEAKNMGINVTCPDINVSEVDFALKDKTTIAFGLLGIKDVGINPARAIVADRSENDNYKSFFDYARRGAAIRKKTVGALVKSGAFDNLNHPRRGLHSVSEVIVKSESKRRHEEKHGIQTLFDMEPNAVKAGIPDLQWSEEDRLALEKEYLGVYVTGHPMSEVKVKGVNITIGEINEMDETNWQRFNIAGIILDKKETITKKGDRMMSFHIEDTSGSLPCVLFPRQTREYGSLINEDDIVYLDVRPQDDRNGVKLIVNKVKPLKGRQILNEKANVHVYVPEGMDLNEVKSLIRNTNGNETVILHYAGNAAILPKEYQSSIETIMQEIQLVDQLIS